MVLLLKNLLFTLLVPGTVALYVPALLVRGREPAAGAAPVVAVLLFAVGAATYTWCVWDFATAGRGTPAPIDAPRKLVVRGLYRFTRNPMYCGVACVVLGWSVLYLDGRLALYLVGAATCFHLVVVLYEEPHLGRVFGREYQAYRAGVGRWLPRRPRRGGRAGELPAPRRASRPGTAGPGPTSAGAREPPARTPSGRGDEPTA